MFTCVLLACDHAPVYFLDKQPVNLWSKFHLFSLKFAQRDMANKNSVSCYNFVLFLCFSSGGVLQVLIWTCLVVRQHQKATLKLYCDVITQQESWENCFRHVAPSLLRLWHAPASRKFSFVGKEAKS